MTHIIMTEFQQRAAAVALMKLFTNKHFSVSDLRAIAKTLGRDVHLAGRDMAALESLHCVDYADMGPKLVEMVREKCLEMLGIPSDIIDEVKSADPSPAQEKRTWSEKFRLAFNL